MSAELIDVRCKLTPEADLALESICRAFNRDKSDVIREILHGWALRKLKEHRELQKLLKSEGVGTEGRGISAAPERHPRDQL